MGAKELGLQDFCGNGVRWGQVSPSIQPQEYHAKCPQAAYPPEKAPDLQRDVVESSWSLDRVKGPGTALALPVASCDRAG